jgi:arsenate reductase
MDYRAMNMKDRLLDLSEAEAIDLLNKNGNLIKRPVLIGRGIGLQGFHPENWDKVFK